MSRNEHTYETLIRLFQLTYFVFYFFKVRAVMGIDFKMIKIHQIVSDSGDICKKSSGVSSKSFCRFVDHILAVKNITNLLVLCLSFSVLYVD